jgi:hypothetical protein
MLRDAVLTPDCQLYYDYPGPHNRNLFGELPGTLLNRSCSCLHNMTANRRLCNSARSSVRLALLPTRTDVHNMIQVYQECCIASLTHDWDLLTQPGYCAVLCCPASRINSWRTQIKRRSCPAYLLYVLCGAVV